MQRASPARPALIRMNATIVGVTVDPPISLVSTTEKSNIPALSNAPKPRIKRETKISARIRDTSAPRFFLPQCERSVRPATKVRASTKTSVMQSAFLDVRA
jgi:hypothetical protein